MTYTGQTDARRKAAKKYREKTVDTLSATIPKGQKAKLKALAAEKGISLNAMLNQLTKYVLEHPEIIKS